MHPSELKNQALVAALRAERDGFTATAEAFKLMATACAVEARDLLLDLSPSGQHSMANSTQSGLRNFEFIS